MLTPHLNVSRADDAPYERHLAILDELRSEGTGSPRAEARLGDHARRAGRDLRSPRLSLGGSHAVLVEFPLSGVPAQGGEELLSHPRAPASSRCSRIRSATGAARVAKVEQWRKAGAVIQMDTAGLLGKGRIAKMSRALLEDGLVDLFASDNHGDTRTLATARDWLLEVSTPEHAELLTRAQCAPAARRRAAAARAAAAAGHRSLRALPRAVPRALSDLATRAITSMHSAFTDALRELAETADRVATELGPDLDRALRDGARHGAAAAARCSSAATAAARPTRSTWRRSTSCATCETGARIPRSRSRRTRRCSRRRETTSGSSNVFARQVEALARKGDLLIIHSTSGNSPNVLRAAEAARAKEVQVLAFSARDGGALRALADHSVVIPTTRTDRAQELHLCIEHIICDLVEQAL